MLTGRVRAALASVAAAFVLCTACSAGTPTGPTSPRNAPRPAPRIARTRFLAFGDSVTAGITAPPVLTAQGVGLPQSYPARLSGLLADRYADQPVIVDNEGRPLEWATDGVQRLPAVIRQLRPEVLILMHGANDLFAEGMAAVAPGLAAMLAMVRDARAAGLQVILCTLPPQRPGGARAAAPAVLASFNQGVRDIARAEPVVLIDVAREFDVAFIGQDGLHPTEGGYVKMAEMLFARLRAEYELPPDLR